MFRHWLDAWVVCGLSAGVALGSAEESDAGQKADNGAEQGQVQGHAESAVTPKPLPAARDDPAARSPAAVVPFGEFTHVQVNVDAFGDNIVGDAANEPSIAVDPNNPNRMAIGWRQFDTVLSNFRLGGWGFSKDGGRTWTFPGVLLPDEFSSDPVLAADNDGDFYYLSLQPDRGPGDWATYVYKSFDRGQSWPQDNYAFGGDKAWLAVDRTGGMGDGHVYSKWQSFGNCCGFDTFTRSTDGGVTFIDPVPVDLGPSFGELAVGPNGEVYSAGIEAEFFQNFDTVVFASSMSARNAALTPDFELSRIVDLGGSMPFGDGPNPDGLLGQINVAADHSGAATHGNIYMLGTIDPPGPDPADIMFARSMDGGFTWSAPVRVNDDPAGTNAWQWFGTMSVAPNGRIDVVFNDTRNTGDSQLNETFYAFSTDAGDTWSENQVISPVWDSHVGWPDQFKIGDYYHMISDAVGADLAWSATFNNEQDVYYTRIGDRDCNRNGVGDAVDLATSSLDLNDNDIPDECEFLGDADDDDDVDLFDFAGFPPCAAGPGVPFGAGCGAFDLDGDGDVDWRDFRILQVSFTGE